MYSRLHHFHIPFGFLHQEQPKFLVHFTPDNFMQVWREKFHAVVRFMHVVRPLFHLLYFLEKWSIMDVFFIPPTFPCLIRHWELLNSFLPASQSSPFLSNISRARVKHFSSFAKESSSSSFSRPTALSLSGVCTLLSSFPAVKSPRSSSVGSSTTSSSFLGLSKFSNPARVNSTPFSL